MRAPHPGAHDQRMTSGDYTRVVIDLDHSREPISGHLMNAAGTVRPFDGWLDLAALLEAAQHECPEPIADPTRDKSSRGVSAGGLPSGSPAPSEPARR
jgi:hypothetical protein